MKYGKFNSASEHPPLDPIDKFNQDRNPSYNDRLRSEDVILHTELSYHFGYYDFRAKKWYAFGNKEPIKVKMLWQSIDEADTKLWDLLDDPVNIN